MISECKICSMFLLIGMIGLFGCRTASVETVVKTSDVSSDFIEESNPAEQSVFQPTFQTPSGKQAFDYAYTIYKSSPAAPTGVFTCQGIVFVIVNIDTEKLRVRFPKGPAMLKAKEFLEKHYHLPDKYSLFSRQIECRDYRREKIFRYVVAYRESDILACCQSAVSEQIPK